MQLFIILALLLYGGKGGAQNLIQEVKPMLEAFGGDEIKDALKSAEEISQVISSINSFASLVPPPAPAESPAPEHRAEAFAGGGVQPDVFPLAPISNVANREITYCLSKYVETH